MKPIARRITRRQERPAQAIDRGSTYNNNPNVNIMYGSGTIVNNNQISSGPVTNYINYASAPKGQVRLFRAT